MKYLFFFFSFITILVGQMSFSGNVITRIGETRTGYYYNESLINNQIQFGRFNSWLQFEFSDPPELGRKFNGLRKLRLEYINGPLQINLGDMYEIWGRGLILNSLDDQTIDRDTGIRGIALKYKTDSFNIHFLTGRNDFSFSTIYSPGYDSRVPNYTASHNIYGANTEWLINNHLAGFTFLQSKELHPVNTFPVDTLDIKNRLIGAHYIYNNSFFDLYVEYLKNWSTTLNQDKNKYDNHIDGRGFYGNINFYFSLFSINLEYINYRFGTLNPTNRWNNVDNYGMSLEFQNPPLANLIHSTTLLNRVSHQTDFNNEIGYKLDILGSITDNYEYLGSVSQSSRSHSWVMNDDYSWEKEGDYARIPLSKPTATPFNTIYGEITGYFMNYALHLKAGFAFSEDIIDLILYSKTDTSKSLNYTYQSAKTLPLHTTYTFSNGWSIDVKIETQWLKKGLWRYREMNGTIIADSLISEFYDENGKQIDIQKNTFISMSIGKTPKWTVAFTLDNTSISEISFGAPSDDVKTSSNSLEDFLGLDRDKNWVNIEFAYNVTSSIRMSLMYGSLKGGLLCANGVCRFIEPFDNGFKMGLTAAF
mgnify:CR=1 FL=1